MCIRDSLSVKFRLDRFILSFCGGKKNDFCRFWPFFRLRHLVMSPIAKFILLPSLALSNIGSVTARHSSSERQPNFATRYLHATGRPSRSTFGSRTIWLLTIYHFFRLIDGSVGRRTTASTAALVCSDVEITGEVVTPLMLSPHYKYCEIDSAVTCRMSALTVTSLEDSS